MTIQQRITQARDFISTDIWKTGDEPGFRGYLLKALRVLIITEREVRKDKIVLKSSALTYLTILSIVPTLALIFGVSKGFGYGINIQKELTKLFPAQEEVMTTAVEFAQNMLDNAKGGIIAGVSVLVLLFTVMRLLNNIEDVFNSIWGKQTSRTWIRKFTDYLAILIVGPTLIILSSSATVFVATQIRSVGEKFEMEYFSKTLAVFLVNVSPYLLIWVLFTLFYIIMPNTKVRFRSGLWAGILAGTVFQATQWGFINFSVMVAKYNAIYGSLAALPLFLMFTQLSWTIVFVGGEFAFALEKVNEYIPDEKDIKFSHAERKKIALLVMQTIVKDFETGAPHNTKRMLSSKLCIPHRFVSNAVNRMVDAGMLIKSRLDNNFRHVYTPALDIGKLDIYTVINRLESHGVNGLFTDENKAFDGLKYAMNGIQEGFKKSKDNKILKDL